jgi:hypothetical protein
MFVKQARINLLYPCKKADGESAGIGIRWRRNVSLTPQPLCSLSRRKYSDELHNSKISNEMLVKHPFAFSAIRIVTITSTYIYITGWTCQYLCLCYIFYTFRSAEVATVVMDFVSAQSECLETHSALFVTDLICNEKKAKSDSCKVVLLGRDVKEFVFFLFFFFLLLSLLFCFF